MFVLSNKNKIVDLLKKKIAVKLLSILEEVPYKMVP